MKVRLFKPSVGKEELRNIREVFERAWLGPGPRVTEFEQRWAGYIGARTAVAVHSCTAALHLALAAFRFPRGKKVLVPQITFASTALAALYNGLEPVFVDVEEDSVGISLEDLQRKWDPDCVAVVPVHFGGHPVAMDELVSWARARDLKVIEDCAHSAGGEYRGRKLGTWGDVGCFSFEEKKCMTTGDGGMICTDDADLLGPLTRLRWLGIDKDTWHRFEQNVAGSPNARHWYYEIRETGFKYGMNDLSAAIGLAQLDKLDGMNRRREQILARYLQGIRDCAGVAPGLPYRLENSSYWLFMVRVARRDRFIEHMQTREVSTGVHYMPLTLHPLFERYRSPTPVADRIWKQFVTLPLFADLTDNEVDYVCRQIRDWETAGSRKVEPGPALR